MVPLACLAVLKTSCLCSESYMATCILFIGGSGCCVLAAHLCVCGYQSRDTVHNKVVCVSRYLSRQKFRSWTYLSSSCFSRLWCMEVPTQQMEVTAQCDFSFVVFFSTRSRDWLYLAMRWSGSILCSMVFVGIWWIVTLWWDFSLKPSESFLVSLLYN